VLFLTPPAIATPRHAKRSKRSSLYPRARVFGRLLSRPITRTYRKLVRDPIRNKARERVRHSMSLRTGVFDGLDRIGLINPNLERLKYARPVPNRHGEVQMVLRRGGNYEGAIWIELPKNQADYEAGVRVRIPSANHSVASSFGLKALFKRAINPYEGFKPMSSFDGDGWVKTFKPKQLEQFLNAVKREHEARLALELWPSQDGW
jgi:hypothetical protein